MIFLYTAIRNLAIIKSSYLVFFNALLLILMLAVSSCQTVDVRDADSPFYSVAAGATLTLNQDLIFYRNKIRKYIQYTEIVSYSDLETSNAYCQFELFEKKPVTQTIKADTFIVERSSYEEVRKQTRPLIYASLDSASFIRTEAPLSYVEYSVFLYLSSDTQKNVFRLVCINWDDAHTGEYLTVNEINGILGPIMTLDINPKPKVVPDQENQEKDVSDE